MKRLTWLLLPATLLMFGCDVEKTEEGRLPDVDVQGGELPEYDVDAPDVDVTTEERTIEVPDVDVDMEEKTVEVPDVDVNAPEDDEVADDRGA